jgi:peptidoglycan L-alanyl-D-glutamate endopeptidase CwlK
MGYSLGNRSRSNLLGVHPSLVRVVERAIQITEQDFMVIEGVRSREQMCINFGKGRTAAQCEAVGVPAKYARPNLAKVTWLRNPFNSNHRIMPDGYGHAVDLVPYPVDWEETKKFDKIAEAMLKAAEELGVDIRWGADWDEDGNPRERGESDSPHFEI